MCAHAQSQDLIDDLKSELSGDFEKTMIGLVMPLAEYLASEVKRAVKGLGTDEAVLIEIICTRNNEEMSAIKDAYKKCKYLVFLIRCHVMTRDNRVQRSKLIASIKVHTFPCVMYPCIMYAFFILS